jgi:hypothetical protein
VPRCCRSAGSSFSRSASRDLQGELRLAIHGFARHGKVLRNWSSIAGHPTCCDAALQAMSIAQILLRIAIFRTLRMTDNRRSPRT